MGWVGYVVGVLALGFGWVVFFGLGIYYICIVDLEYELYSK